MLDVLLFFLFILERFIQLDGKLVGSMRGGGVLGIMFNKKGKGETIADNLLNQDINVLSERKINPATFRSMR